MTISSIIPFKQVRPGDALDPVEEWARQLEGSLKIDGQLIEYDVDNADRVDIPHSLGRRPFGAILLGLFGTSGTPRVVSYAVDIDASTETHLHVDISSAVTLRSRWMVF